MADDSNRPYIGYRSAGRRPERQQDRRAAADAPLAALRGFVSGVAGAPGDIESLIRLLPGLSEQTVLPTSEDIERRLPLRSVSETPAGRAFTTAGQLGGGSYAGPGSPLRVIAALPSAVSRAGREFAVAAGQPPVNVIKPKGGNWLAGSVERAIEPMRQTTLTDLGYANLAERAPEVAAEARAIHDPRRAMNRWLETKLAKYIRNEMGTPEDPLRALAERGVSHLPIDELERAAAWEPQSLGPRRKAAGFPEEGFATTPPGKAWEQLADEAIHNMPARMRISPETGGGSTKALQVEQENPWLMKVPPETMTYGVYPVEVRSELGFEHLADELRNAINPDSGLPAHLLWKYQDLDKVTVPQAVERVAKINEWRAAQKAEADMARANNAAAHLFKEYPEQGFRWVELKAPEVELGKLGYTTEEVNGLFHAVDPKGNVVVGSRGKSAEEALKRARAIDKESIKSLEDALKYEGETMGHCVGGYCPDVIEGRSRIFSLRDKKGQPHVTVEVQPERGSPYDYWYGQRAHLGEQDPELQDFLKWTRENRPKGGLDSMYEQWAAATGREVQQAPQSIVQIKGKANRAPNAEYLPYVQDFVRSGRWSRVGDLENTGFVRNAHPGQKINLFGGEQLEIPSYMTPDEYKKFVREGFKGRADPESVEGYLKGLFGSEYKPEGYAEGGAVSAPTATTYDPSEIDTIVSRMKEEFHA